MQAAGHVVGEVPEPEGRASQVFQPAIQCLGRAVRGAGSIEVGQPVGDSLLLSTEQHALGRSPAKASRH